MTETTGTLPDLDKVSDIATTTPKTEEVAPILTQKAVESYRKSGMDMAEFESQVQLAKNNGYQWIEVPKETLMMVCHGEYPPTHYIVYKGVKVACEGTAKDCMAKEKSTAHEKVFPNDKQRMR